MEIEVWLIEVYKPQFLLSIRERNGEERNFQTVRDIECVSIIGHMIENSLETKIDIDQAIAPRA